MKVKIAMVGCGAFAQCFIPLFKAHPMVEKIWLCDSNKEKLEENVKRFEIPDTFDSLDEACASSEVDAVAIITQNWMHAPQAIQAMKAGKHVYSAVPAGITIEQLQQLVETVNETGQVYMMGETGYYMPGVVYARKRYEAGDFGDIVYCEGQYFHDWSHGLYDVMKWRGGDDWKLYAGSPPMHYPTHSIGAVLGVTDSHLTSVSCQGFVDHHEDGLYAAGVNQWDNRFSNQTALFTAADGSSVRINEFRRIGHPSADNSSIFGTKASMEMGEAGPVWVTLDRNETQRLSEQLTPRKIEAHVTGGMEKLGDDARAGLAPIHDSDRLPKEFIGLPNGHGGSHQFLVDDFVKAAASGKQPVVNVWRAARYTVPGIIAHESALRDGERMQVPDLGAPPTECIAIPRA